MEKKEIVKDLFKKSIIPLIAAGLLFYFSTVLTDEFFYIWIICGIPFGFKKISVWFSMINGGLGETAAIFVLNFVLAGLIGGFIFIWRVIKAIYNMPILIYQLIKAK